MKQKEIARLHELTQLAEYLKNLGETATAETILQHIAHTIAETLGESNGESRSSPSV